MKISSRLIALSLALLFGAVIAGQAVAQQVSAEQALTAALQALEEDDNHEALRSAHQAMLILTQRDQFHIRTAKLVEPGSTGFGIYRERKTNVFRPGDEVHVYLEPGAFKYGGPDGRFDFGFTVDFRLATPDGNILGGQDDFGKFPFQSLRPNTEISLDITLTLTEVPVGEFVLKIVVHDMISEETETVDIPVVFSDT